MRKYMVFVMALISVGFLNAQQTTTPLYIDALKASPANFKLLLENQYVRVLEYTLEPSKKDMWHTHPAKSSYIVEGGQLKVYLENGEIIMADEKAGTAFWSDAVGKHYVENVGKTTVRIILTEIKSLENRRIDILGAFQTEFKMYNKKSQD